MAAPIVCDMWESKKEKELRATLKSAVQRQLTKDVVIILDSLNYIKGYRYELHCVVKACQTPGCVIHCDIHPDRAAEFNRNRPENERYTQEIFDALAMRFEPPNSQHRWDSPLFLVHPEDEMPCQQIYEALYLKKAPPPNLSTQAAPISSTNFLHELDKITQNTIQVLIAAQKTSLPGDLVTVPGAVDKIKYVKPMTLAELQRLRRQFISYTKMHTIEDTSKLANMFVQYINNTVC